MRGAGGITLPVDVTPPESGGPPLTTKRLAIYATPPAMQLAPGEALRTHLALGAVHGLGQHQVEEPFTLCDRLRLLG
jgi:hypothetical protein